MIHVLAGNEQQTIMIGNVVNRQFKMTVVVVVVTFFNKTLTVTQQSIKTS